MDDLSNKSNNCYRKITVSQQKYILVNRWLTVRQPGGLDADVFPPHKQIRLLTINIVFHVNLISDSKSLDTEWFPENPWGKKPEESAASLSLGFLSGVCLSDEWQAEVFVSSEPRAAFTFFGVMSLLGGRRRMLAIWHEDVADGANEAVGSLAANWAVSAKTGVRHLFVREEHLVASRPSTGPSLSPWCDINSSSSQTDGKNEKKKETGENDKQRGEMKGGGGGRH